MKNIKYTIEEVACLLKIDEEFAIELITKVFPEFSQGKMSMIPAVDLYIWLINAWFNVDCGYVIYPYF